MKTRRARNDRSVRLPVGVVLACGLAGGWGVGVSASVTITPLLAGGQGAPGLAGATVADAHGARVTPDGRVVAWIALAGNGVTIANDSAAVLLSPGLPGSVLLRKGDVIEGFAPAGVGGVGGLPYPNIDELGRLSVTVARAAVEPESTQTYPVFRNGLLSRWRPGDGPILVDGSVFQAGSERYDGLTTTPGGRSIAFYDVIGEEGAEVTPILVRGQEAPGYTDRRVIAGLGLPGVSAAGAVAVRATFNALTDPAGTTPAGSALYTNLGGALAVMATTNQPPVVGDAFLELGAQPSIDDAAGVAFWARTGPETPGGTREVIVRSASGTLSTVLQTGQSIVTPGGVGVINRIDRQCAQLASGAVVVLAGVAIPGDTAGLRNTALLRVGASGDVSVIAQEGSWPIAGSGTETIGFFGTYGVSSSGRVVFSVRTRQSPLSAQVLLTADGAGRTEEIARSGTSVDLSALGLGVKTVREIVFEGSVAGTVSGAGAYGQVSTTPGGGGSVVFGVQFTDFTTGVLRGRAGCRGDVDDDGVRSKADLAQFLSEYFAGDRRSDTDGSGVLSPRDIFMFLTGYFGGC